MGEAEKRSRLYFNQWGCMKKFSGGAFLTAFSTSICFSEQKQPPWNLQNWAINLTRRNFPWEIHHLQLRSEPETLQEPFPVGLNISSLLESTSADIKEWEAVRRWGTEPKFEDARTFPCLKGVVGEGGKESNCIQIALSFPTRFLSLAGLTVSTHSVSEPSTS